MSAPFTYRPCRAGGVGLAFTLALLPLLFGACSATGPRLQTFDIASRYLPSVRKVPLPDTARHLQRVTTDAGFTRYELDRPLARIQQDWSVTYRRIQRGRFFATGEYRTFATLESLDLALGRVVQEVGAGGLTQDVATRLLDEERARYQDVFTVDVVVFVDAASERRYLLTDLNELNATVRLRDDRGVTYEAARIEALGQPQQTPIGAGDAGAFYQTNVVYFQRTTEKGDPLARPGRLVLELATFRPQQTNLSFTWRIEADG